ASVQTDGRYSVELVRLDGPAVGLRERVRLEVLDGQGRPLAATPGFVTVGLRELATGERTQDLRLGTIRKPWRLVRGINLLSVPVNPDTTGRTAFLASELARRTGASYVVRGGATASGDSRFEIYLEGLTPPFAVQGNEGYIVFRQGADATVDLEGVAWSETQASRTLPRGVGLLGLPFGPQPGQTMRDLLEQSGGDFAVRARQGRFEVSLPGAAAAFTLEDGMGYIVAAPRPQPVTLPGQP
ncbi:MAG: hypothetical protein HY814_12845, partial [Candidatus Riflebacteria bacterium]|nr:hypothetical protein [Candidatus Riflebacteria bacterium]